MGHVSKSTACPGPQLLSRHGGAAAFCGAMRDSRTTANGPATPPAERRKDTFSDSARLSEAGRRRSRDRRARLLRLPHTVQFRCTIAAVVAR